MPNETPAEPAIEPTTRPDHHGLGVDPPDEPKRKRGVVRWLVRLAVVFVLLALLLIGLAPMLLSTGPGTAVVVSMINSRVNGEVTIDDLRLRWGKGQRVTGLTFKKPGVEGSIGVIDAQDLSLFDLLTGSRDLGVVRASVVEVVYSEPRGEPQAEQPRDEPRGDAEPQPFALSPGLSVELVVEDLTIQYRADEQEPVVVSMDEGSFEMPDLRDIRFQFDLAVRMGEESGRVTLGGAVLNLFDPDGVMQEMQAHYDLASTVESVPVDALDRVLQLMEGGPLRPGQLAGVLGGGDLDAEAMVKGTVDELASKLTADTPSLHVELYQERDGGMLVASPKSNARLKLDDAGFAALFPETPYTLLEPSGIDLESLQMRLPTTDDGIDWDQATASVRLKADANLAIKDPEGRVVGIDALAITGGSESLAKQIDIEASAVLSEVTDDAGAAVVREAVGLEVTVRNPMDASAREIDLFSKALPIQLADWLTNQEGRLVLWLGELLAMDAELHARVTTDAGGETVLIQDYALRPEGRVTGEIVGTIAPDHYTISTRDKRPVEAVLSPEAFASLMELLSGKPGRPALTIDRAMPVYVTARDAERGEVSIKTDPTKEGVKRFFPDPDQTYVGLSIELSPARVYDPNRKKTYELRGGTLVLSAPDLRGKTMIRADLEFGVRPGAGERGVASVLTLQTSVSDLLDTEGGLPLDGAALMQQIGLDGGVSLVNVPSGLFDSLLNQQGGIASVLGPVVGQLDAGFTYADGHPTGATVKLNWDEQNNQPLPGAWASLKPVAFDIDAQRMMTVRGGADIELEVRVSEAFGDRWMGQLHPVLFDAKSGDRPVKITIKGSSFRFPLDPPAAAPKGGAGAPDAQPTLDLKGARVEAEVDLGSIEFGEDALLGRLLEWTDHAGDRAVFEPVRVSMVDGRLSYDGFGLAVGNVKLRLDGEVDLSNGQIVDMAVRVPGESLIKVFHELDGVIGRDDTLSIPMSGPIRNPAFDRKLITQEVTRLLAKNLIEKQKQKLEDKLFRKLREKVGAGEKDAPKDPPGEQPPAEDKPAPDKPEPEKPLEDQVRDELIERGLDLLFGGGRRQQDDPDEP